MASKSTIINVTINGSTYTATYSTGTIRTASVDKMPGTVRAWLEAHKEPEPELIPIQESMTESFYEYCTEEKITENWQEIVREERGELVAQEPAKIAAQIQAGPGAAESVAFGVCMAIAVAFWGAAGLVQILAAMVTTAWQIIAPRARAWIVGAVRRLPEIRTAKAAVAMVRILTVLIGTAALLI